MNGRSLAVVLWRRRLIAAGVFLLVAAATAACLLFAARSYTASATVAVTPKPSIASAHGTVSDLRQTLAELADSGPVLADVRDRVGTRRSVAALRDEVSAERVDGTVLIRISVEDRDPGYARRIANAVADALPKHDPSGGQFTFASAGGATRPRDFSTPDVVEVIALGAVLAVVLAFGSALLRERAAGRVDDEHQLAALTSAPVLASISRPSDPAEMPSDSAAGPSAAQFRALRVALEFASQEEPTSVVVVAPVEPEAAAAWTTLNLAAALAKVEHRVLVVDADFGGKHRHPALKSKGPGLAEVMRGSVEVRDAVRATTVSGVSVLPAGHLGGTSAADLVELRFHKAIGQIGHEVDLILVHAAPLLDSDDARVMAAGNALLLTMAPGRVRAPAMRQVAAELHRLRLRLIGTVLLARHR